MMSVDKEYRARILIVEDELIIAQNLKTQLEKLGFKVTDITIDDEGTRAALKKELPDLVLMDITLYGGSDGVILARWVDQNYNIPVIFLTSHTDIATFQRASKSMPYGYLIKPVNPNELFNTIELILQRHRLLNKLTANSYLFNSVLQSIGEAVVVTDENRNFLYLNRSAEKLLETRLEEIGSSSIDDILLFRNPLNGSVPSEWDLHKIHDQQHISFECNLQTVSRTNRLVVNLSQLGNLIPEESHEGYLIVMRDISQSKNVENIFSKIAGSVAVDVGEAFFHSLTTSLTEILDVDYCLLGNFQPEDSLEYSILSAYSRANGSHVNMEPATIKDTPAEPLNRSEKIIFIPENVREHFPNDRNLREWKIKGYAAAPLNAANGKTTGVLIIMSRRKLEDPEIIKSVLQILAQRAVGEMERLQYEHQLITERNRADEMNTLKNNFLSNMSHEVRTPLNSIIGFSNLLKEGISDEQQLEYLTYIEEGGYRLMQTIDDILDLSVLETNPGTIQFQKIDLESLLDNALGLYSTMARDKRIVLDKIVNTPGIIVQSEPRMLAQVIRKLIENAIKFTDQGSVMATLDVESRNRRSYGLVRVSDTGIGIDKSFLPQLFDEFMQESRGLGRQYEGVGLGLTIVKKMLGLMNGYIEVESEKGKGSVFTIYIPLDV